MQHEYRSTPICEYLCGFSQYPVYYTLGIININQLCVLGIDAKKHRQKDCSKNEVISFLLQPFYIFFLCLDYIGTLVNQNRRVLFVKVSHLGALINQYRRVLFVKVSYYKCSYKLEQACSNSKSLTYRPPYKLEQACTNFRKQCI